MKFEFEIDSDNAAFSDSPELEVARLLRQTAKRIEGQDEGLLIDINGNKVGYWFIEVPNDDT